MIGAGHNGLVAAASLAKDGRRVTVLERASEVGGILRGSEIAPGFTAPGVAHTVGRLRRSIVEELSSADHGLSLLTPAVRMFAPQPDGSSVTFWGDAARTAEELRERNPRDADAFIEFDRKVRAVASLPRLRERRHAARTSARRRSPTRSRGSRSGGRSGGSARGTVARRSA